MSKIKRKITKLDYFLALRPCAGGSPDECGDTGVIREFDNKVFMAIVDVLGHDKDASLVAETCKDFLAKNHRKNLIEIMEGLHGCVNRSRGVAVGLCVLDLDSGELRYIGVGNIGARKFGSSTASILSRSGVVGYMMPTPKEERMKLYDGDILILHTDGVRQDLELEDYPEILVDSAKTVATNIIHRFGKDNDDAVYRALRYKR